MFKVEKNVPMPKDAKRGRKPKYPFALMEVGDSFEFSFSEVSPRTISSAVSYYGSRHKKYFSVRTISKTKGRVWRVE